jgi:hypothetical protein
MGAAVGSTGAGSTGAAVGSTGAAVGSALAQAPNASERTNTKVKIQANFFIFFSCLNNFGWLIVSMVEIWN